MVQKLIIVCGIPASGKTGFVDNVLKSEYDNVVIVSRSKIRQSMYDKSEPSEYLDHEDTVKKRFYGEIKYYLKAGKTVIVDALNTRIKARKKVIKIAKKYIDIENIVVYFLDSPLEDCILRNNRRELLCYPKVSNKVIKKCYEGLEIPTYDEGIGEIIKIKVPSWVV